MRFANPTTLLVVLLAGALNLISVDGARIFPCPSAKPHGYCGEVKDNLYTLWHAFPEGGAILLQPITTLSSVSIVRRPDRQAFLDRLLVQPASTVWLGAVPPPLFSEFRNDQIHIFSERL
ncbi:hypothetical protein PSHT_16510 [Puccinia striiformis]|uniref:Uncharacterized protein n=1 Tax=Puccinia striiformis TaxID=27350 RepID=A0A2S4U9V2_9BASI|nr:hypothetical protein PSHT_16510 [Puccinia striiformis]